MAIDRDNVKTAIVKWLEEVEKSNPVPSDIVALNFGLYEPYGIELTGSKTYDVEDDDWACEEYYEPAQRNCPNLQISKDNNWEMVLEAVTEILKNIVDEYNWKIFNVEHITTGFSDGRDHPEFCVKPPTGVK